MPGRTPCGALRGSGDDCEIALVQGLVAIGRAAEGIALVNETIRQVEANGGLSYLPELLRVKGSVLLVDAAARWLTTRKAVLYAVA